MGAPGGECPGDAAALATVERAIILKSAGIFAETPEAVLAEVASLLEKIDYNRGEAIFEKGSTGDCLYVIVAGRVRVHDGEATLTYLGEREVFGEVALLDAEPRSASVTAVEDTRLLRLDQGPFYDLLADRSEVAGGIIRIVSRELRARLRDLAELNARWQELTAGRSQRPHPEADVGAWGDAA